MPYNKQTNPYGVASSELGWRGFADGGRMSNPGAIAPPKDDIYKKLAVKAITDIGGAAWNEYTSPVNEGQTMWGDELSRFDTAIAAQKTPEAIEGAERAKRDFISSHPNAGKEIYQRPEWTDKVPDFLMPGGSRFNTPEGAINPRQAGTIRRNWKADPNFTPEAGPLADKTVVKPVVNPPYDPTVKENVPFPTDPNKSQVGQYFEKDRKQQELGIRMSRLQGMLLEDLKPNTPDIFLNDKDLALQKRRDKMAKWLYGPGIGFFRNNPSMFIDNPKEFENWFYSKGPGQASK